VSVEEGGKGREGLLTRIELTTESHQSLEVIICFSSLLKSFSLSSEVDICFKSLLKKFHLKLS